LAGGLPFFPFFSMPSGRSAPCYSQIFFPGFSPILFVSPSPLSGAAFCHSDSPVQSPPVNLRFWIFEFDFSGGPEREMGPSVQSQIFSWFCFRSCGWNPFFFPLLPYFLRFVWPAYFLGFFLYCKPTGAPFPLLNFFGAALANGRVSVLPNCGSPLSFFYRTTFQ